MTVLLVEDDTRLSDYLKVALGREGYTVDICASIPEVYSYMALPDHAPSVVILDRMLGKEDGATLIPALRTRFTEAGILILSSLDLPTEKARIIDAGADDYLSKPFALEELTARIRLVLRPRAGRGGSDSTTVRSVGNLSLDLKTQTARIGASKVDLTRKEFQILSLLMDHPGRVFNKFQILDRVWEMERLTESNVVETAVKVLRRKLSEAECTARIESKRNVGYWIEA